MSEKPTIHDHMLTRSGLGGASSDKKANETESAERAQERQEWTQHNIDSLKSVSGKNK
jgi:hypothetical protein